MGDEKSLIFGVSDHIDKLIMMLISQNIEVDLEHDYYLNIPPPPIENAEEVFGDAVISGVFVDLTEELVKAILNWIEIRKKKKLKDLKLAISIGGNILKVTSSNLNIILKVMEECSKRKKN